MEEPLIFVNGQRHDCLPVGDRGLAYGHGLFETMKLRAGELPLWSLHRERALDGCARLGIAVTADRLDHHLFSLLPALPSDGVVKLIVTAGSGGRGYRLEPGNLAPTVIIQWFSPRPSASSVSAQLCRYRLPHNPHLAGIKHLNRLDQVIAAAELAPDVEGLLLDADGAVIEGLSHNLFVLSEGQWLTPSLDQCGVAGVMRRFVLETLMPALDMPVRVGRLEAGQLGSASELFVCNAVTGVTPVAGIADVGHWSHWPQTRALCNTLEEYWS